MLHKHNIERRHHIQKMPLRVTNWTEYEAGLRRRGSHDAVGNGRGLLPARWTAGNRSLAEDRYCRNRTFATDGLWPT